MALIARTYHPHALLPGVAMRTSWISSSCTPHRRPCAIGSGKQKAPPAWLVYRIPTGRTLLALPRALRHARSVSDPTRRGVRRTVGVGVGWAAYGRASA